MQASLHCTLPSTFLRCKGQGYWRFLWTKTLNFLPFPFTAILEELTLAPFSRITEVYGFAVGTQLVSGKIWYQIQVTRC